MKSAPVVPVLLALCLSLLPAKARPAESPAVWRISDGTRLGFHDILEDLENSSLVFVGELHDRPEIHRMQLKIIEALHRRGRRPLAVGLEMFRKEDQKALDDWVAGKTPEEEFEKIYLRNWNFPWSLYRDIFVFARDRGIPLVGLNVPPEITRKVAREGFAALTEEERGRLPMVTCRVDSAYMEFIRRAHGSHGHHGGDFEHFCEAQLVWDTAMAHRLVELLQARPDHTVVVLAGTGHAWKPGIPDQIRFLNEELTYRVVLPAIQGRLEEESVSPRDADYLWLEF